MATKKSGFSLVELSIVLVILGLLVGGVLSGQSLIHAAQLRSVSTEYNTWQTAIKTFRGKYFGLPADITNGTAFWGYQGGSACNNLTGTAVTTPGTCDGDGDGSMSLSGTTNNAEDFQFWKQLGYAGLINGKYNSGYYAGTMFQKAGYNIPASKLGSNGWMVTYFGAWPEAPFYYFNMFRLGTDQNLTFNQLPGMTAEDAWNIDTKMDDGKPDSGAVREGASWLDPTCVSGVYPATTYAVGTSGIICAMEFRL